jgi:RNAse (barnase) inhibitor barstar
MKVKEFALTMLFSVFFFLLACQESQKPDAEEFNKIVNSNRQSIVEKIQALGESFIGRDEKIMTDRLEQLKERIDKSIDSIDAVKDEPKYEQYKKAALELFEFYKSVAGIEFKEIVDILRLKDDEMNEDMRIRINEINNQLMQREPAMIKRFSAAQEDFQRKFNLTIKK